MTTQTLKILCRSLWLLLAIAGTMPIEQAKANNEFFMRVNKVFTSQDSVEVYIDRGWRYRRKDAFEADIWLYKAKDIQSFLEANNAQLPGPGKELPKLALQKHFEEIRQWQQTSNKNSKIELGLLEEGLYILEVYAYGNRIQMPVVVSNTMIANRTVKNQSIVFLANSFTGRKVEDMKVVYSEQVDGKPIIFQPLGEGLYSYTSTKEIERKSNEEYFYAYKGDKLAVSRGYINYTSTEDEKPEGYIYTDRPGYRPEQTIYFSGVLRMKDGQRLVPITDSVTYTLMYGSNDKLLKKKVALSEDGLFSDSIRIDKSWKLGDYEIIVSKKQLPRYMWNWQGGLSCEFVIQEYKKPEYEVSVSFDREQYVLGDKAVATIKADYFFGSPVKEAAVEYSLVRERMHVPYWRRYAYWWWYDGYYSYRNEKEVIARSRGRLNKDGEFSVVFDIERPDGETAKNYKYTLVANVIDASRRAVTGSASATASWMPYLLSVNSEEYYYDVDEEATITASVTDLQERPIKQQVHFKVTQRTWDYVEGYITKVFKEEALLTDAKTGLAQLKFTPEKPGYYQVEAVLQEGGKKLEETASFYVFNENSWWNWDNNGGSISIMTNKKVYQRGEKVEVNIMTEDAADILFVANNHEVLDYKVISLSKPEPPLKEAAAQKGTSTSYELDLSMAKPYGPVELAVAYVKDGTYHYKKEEIIVIPTEQYLDVSVSFDQAQYKPDTWAEATVKVLDAAGNPVPNASVSLSTADEAVYFLYGDKSGDIRQKIYQQKEISSWTSQTHNEFYYSEYSLAASMIQLAMKYQDHKGEVGKYFFFNHRDKKWNLRRGNYLDSNLVSTIKGFVVDASTGKPLSEAKVKIGKKEFKTNKYGIYAVKGFEKGYVTVEIEHEGKKFKLEDIRFGNLASIVLHVALAKGKEHIQLNKNEEIKKRGDEGKLKDAYKYLFGDELRTMYPIEPNMVEVYDDEEVEEEIEDEMLFSSSGGDDWGGGGAEAIAASAPSSRNALRPDRPTFKKATIRKNFKDAIYWNPSVKTDAQGNVKVKIKLPDNLTTWRTLAKVVTKDSKVGQAMAKVVVRKNLLVRMETPRFITTNDRMLIATNIHNYLNEAKKVKVSLVANGVEVEGTEQIIRVAANGEKRIDWPITAPWLLKAQLTVEALTDEESDAMRMEVPVQPNGLEMLLSKAAYNQGNSATEIAFDIEQSIDLNTASVELSIAPGVTAALLSSMDDLIGYPYGCVEQTMSRFLPNVLVSNTLKKVGSRYSSNIDAEELQKMVAQGTKRLGELQHNDGGWGWWRDDETHPYYTAYVMFGLKLGKQAGYDIPEALYENGLEALRRQVAGKAAKNDQTLEAYQMMVAMHCGLLDQWDGSRLDMQNLDNAYEAALWMQAALMKGDQALASEVKDWLMKNVKEDVKGTSYWGGQRYYYRWQDDRVETTAHVVRALAMQNPKNPMLGPAAQWLMMQRKGKSWHNTRQTAMTIFGLNELISQELDVNARMSVYVNGTMIKSLQFGGNQAADGDLLLQAETIEASIKPLMEHSEGYSVLKHGKNTIRLLFEGEGRAYANAQLRYFMEKGGSNLSTLRKEAPFAVRRQYFKLKPKSLAGKLVYEKEPIAESKIQSGDVILVKTVVNAKEKRENVLIEDPIPAGCEFVQQKDPYIIVGEEEYSDGFDGGWGSGSFWSNWYTHQEYRDNRYAMTITYLTQGKYEYSYLMRAQIPGLFQVNPAVAQLMYYPEVRGFSEFSELEIGE